MDKNITVRSWSLRGTQNEKIILDNFCSSCAEKSKWKYQSDTSINLELRNRLFLSRVRTLQKNSDNPSLENCHRKSS